MQMPFRKVRGRRSQSPSSRSERDGERERVPESYAVIRILSDEAELSAALQRAAAFDRRAQDQIRQRTARYDALANSKAVRSRGPVTGSSGHGPLPTVARSA